MNEIQKSWSINLKIDALHDANELEERGFPNEDEIRDFFNFFLQQGYTDVWQDAMITEVEIEE